MPGWRLLGGVADRGRVMSVVVHRLSLDLDHRGRGTMADLKAEYASMESAARHLRAAIGHLPGAIVAFQHGSRSVDAFGHLPESAKAKHTVEDAMRQLGQFAGDLHTEWESEADGLVKIADVLRRVDALLAREARNKG